MTSAYLGAIKGGYFIALTTHCPTPLFLPLTLSRVWETGQTADVIVRRLKAAADGGGGFCEDAAGRPYFLRRIDDLHEGQRIQIEIMAEARGTKPALAQIYQGAPRPLALGHTLCRLGHTGPIEIADLGILKQLRAAFPNDQFIHGPTNQVLEDRAADCLDICDMAQGQVRLIFESTQTAHHIDIDGQGSARDINKTACELAAELILMRNLGGLIFMDFLALPSKAERRDMATALSDKLRAQPHQVKIHAMNESGHLIVERQRLGPEFLETYFDN